MSTIGLILAEIRFRFVNFMLCLMAIAIAGTLFVVGPSLVAGYAKVTDEQLQRLDDEAAQLQADTEAMNAETNRVLADMDKQTKRIMRDLGVNLRIVHKDTNFGSLYADFAAVDFPESYVQRLAEAPSIETIVHLVATLQHKIKWKDRTALLVGTLPVVTQSQKNEEKPHMVKSIEQGTVYVGHELGGGLKQGDSIEVEGHSLRVAQIMPEYGELQDVQLLVNLKDAQAILGKEGQINQIMALNCKCKGDRLSAVRAELEGVLEDTKVTEHKTRATAREKQRDLVSAARKAELAQMQTNLDRVIANRDRQKTSRLQQQRRMNNLLAIITPIVVLACALFVALMMWLNVRDRRAEIGVLRALGKGATSIAGLFIGKAALVGLLGGAAGCALGYFLAPIVGNSTMDISAAYFHTDAVIVIATLAGAPLVAAMASYLPALVAVNQDPAIVLMDH